LLASSDALVPLARGSLPPDTVELARFLIGALLCRRSAAGLTAARIVETEAYTPGDPSSHAFRGERPRCRAMFLDVGFAYVYRIYGTAFCLNVVSERPGVGAAVLVRAAEPVGGAALMTARRSGAALRDLARGPGRLTAALDVGLEHDGADLCAGLDLWLAASPRPAGPIGTSLRIGITKAADWPLRFYEIGSPHVSGPRRLNK
jgi:DNA-3-methyladenine glycosylase